MRYFDYRKMAREAKIPDAALAKLAGRARLEFPTDEMMYELHLLRACAAIRDGHLTLKVALRPERGESA